MHEIDRHERERIDHVVTRAAAALAICMLVGALVGGVAGLADSDVSLWVARGLYVGAGIGLLAAIVVVVRDEPDRERAR